MIRFSAKLGFLWPGRPLLDRIAAASRAGFEAIELHWPYDVAPDLVAEASRKAGVILLGINTIGGDAARGEFGLGALPGREADFGAAIRQSVDYCVAAHGRAIHVMSGLVAESDETTAVFVSNLKHASAMAAMHGIQLLIEPINRYDKPGYFLTRVEQADAIIRSIGAPNIGILFDFYHVAREQGDVLRRFEGVLPRIGHVQIAAVPSRAEPDEGELDYAQVLSRIDALGYAGWIGCEYRPRADTDAGLKWLDDYRTDTRMASAVPSITRR